MGRANVILKNSFIYAIGTFGAKALSFLLLPIYTFYLSKKDLGIYDVLLTSISLFVPVVSLQLGYANYRWLLSCSNDKSKMQSAVSNSTVLILISVIFSLILFTIAFLFISVDYPIYFLLLLIVSALYAYGQQSLRGLGKNKLYAVVGILYVILLLAFNVLFLICWKWKIEGLLIATILANLIATIYIFIKAKWYKYFNIKLLNIKEMMSMLRYSWPLIPNTISWWLINASDKYIILYYMGTSYNGIYAVSNRIPAVILIVNSIFTLAWQDQILSGKNDYTKEEMSNNSIMLKKFIVLELCFTLVLIALSKFIIKYFIADSFMEAWKYIPLLSVGVAYMAFSSVIGAAYLKMKNTTGVFTTSLIGGILNVLISILLMKKIGLYAPALGTFASFLLIFIIRSIQTKTYFEIGIYVRELLLYSALCLLFIYLVSVDNPVISFVCLLASLIIFVLNSYKSFLLLAKKIPHLIKK